MSGAMPPTARVDFAEVYSKCAFAFTSGEIKRGSVNRKPVTVPGYNGIHYLRGKR